VKNIPGKGDITCKKGPEAGTEDLKDKKQTVKSECRVQSCE
jgi:hypothetical protein